MFSWYAFISTFVSAMSLIALWIIALKNRGYLEYTNEEHLHDVGKFMFAFSIFWTYLWFSQYMLIWYANIPEETVYFKSRISAQGHKGGAYSGIFWCSLLHHQTPTNPNTRNTTIKNALILLFCSKAFFSPFSTDTYSLALAI